MKLYPIIYLNEAAPTATEAIGKDVAAITSDDYADWEMESPSEHSIVLIDVGRAKSIMQPGGRPASAGRHSWAASPWPGIRQRAGGMSESDTYTISKLIANRAVVGYVAYSDSDENLWKIDASAGVASFGPLAYQLAMWSTGGWLESDTSLKPASQRVWQKMYELSEQGVYKRKWLGEWNESHLSERMHIGPAPQDLGEYITKVVHGEIDYEDEQAFLSWLQENNLKPETYGWLWAYQLVSHDSNTRSLFDKGKQLIKDLREIYPQFTEKDLGWLFSDAAGRKFFRRLYGGKASY